MNRLAVAGFLAWVTLDANVSHAHAVGVSRGEYRLTAQGVRSELVFARPEVALAVPGLDADGDGAVSEDELDRGRPLVATSVLGGVEVFAGDRHCTGAFEGVALAEQDGLVVRLDHRCAGGAAGPLSIRLGLLSSLSLGHRHLATVSGAADHRAILYEAEPEIRLAASGRAAGAGVAWPLFRLGVHHILTGYDHLLFLLGLLLVGGRLRALLAVVTAFTLGHSVTLALAVLGAGGPSPRVVEPAIALSIAYVGIENWFVRSADRRWMLTLAFGLVHGFGFAGALAEIEVPSGQVPVALAAFNAGVEAGQLAVLACVLPALVWLGRRPWFAERGVRALSTAVALCGLVWFVERLA